MRLALATCVWLLLCGVAHGQAGTDAEHVIRREIDTGLFDGHDTKVIGGVGDAAAVLVTKILGGRDLTTPDIDSVLIVFHDSFADPSFVNIAADREPRTALFVLKRFDSSTSDSALKERIEETREYVQQRYAKFIRDQTQK
jgi:hypothetical protein